MLHFAPLPSRDALPPLVIHLPIEKKHRFDSNQFLAAIGGGRKVVFLNNETIFAQGDPADAVFYIQKGKVKLSVVSKTGKQATISMLGEGEFLGEGCLAGQSVRMESATAITHCDVLRIEKTAMVEMLHREHAFSAKFVEHLLARNTRWEADLVDLLFNFSEKRLARILLQLAHFDKDGNSEIALPRISHKTLAEMVGTTRSRVSFFMNRFRRLGFVDYGSRNGLQVHSSLLRMVLQEGLNPVKSTERTRQRVRVWRLVGYEVGKWSFHNCPSCSTSTRKSASNRAVEKRPASSD
jgi:CRP/FNR family transcriptional regulator, cyclic AMP receptor protein